MITIDAMGKQCPIPVVLARKAMRESPPNETLHIFVDNEIATQNLEKMATAMGLGFACTQKAQFHFLVELTKGNGLVGEKLSAPISSYKCSGSVVVVGGDSLGRGDDTLGASLMKMFIYTLAELDEPPSAVLFYNSGVKLTTQNAPTIPDLELLALRGCQILSCGACLNFYGLEDKLAVGEVTNMLNIVELQNTAIRVITV